jgi:hypothetical protein
VPADGLANAMVNTRIFIFPIFESYCCSLVKKSEIHWAGLGWAGLDWTGLDRTGLDWTGLDWGGSAAKNLTA